MPQVKKSICVLLQHHLVTLTVQQGKKPVVYRMEPDQVVLRVQFPRWIHLAKAEFGDAGELIVEDILHQGHTPMAQVGGGGGGGEGGNAGGYPPVGGAKEQDTP